MAHEKISVETSGSNNHRKPHKQTIRSAKFAAGVAAFGAFVLATGKLILYWQTGSLIIALSAWDSSIDVVISLINQRIVTFARQGADKEHPYGHGKAESIAALGQGALITGGALAIFASSLMQANAQVTNTLQVTPQHWTTPAFFFGAACLSVFITQWLKYHGKEHDSPALLADAEHYKVDVISNLGSGISIGIILLTKQYWLDFIFASAFALYIGWGGVSLLRTSIDELMDHDVTDEVKKKVLALITSVSDDIHDVHKFRGRKSGHRYFFDFHITLTSALSFIEAHAITEQVEDLVKEYFDADVVVHMDPDSLPAADSIALTNTQKPPPHAPHL